MLHSIDFDPLILPALSPIPAISRSLRMLTHNPESISAVLLIFAARSTNPTSEEQAQAKALYASNDGDAVSHLATDLQAATTCAAFGLKTFEKQESETLAGMSTIALAQPSEQDAVHVGNLHNHSKIAASEPVREGPQLDAAGVPRIKRTKGYSRDIRRFISDLELRLFAQPRMYVAE